MTPMLCPACTDVNLAMTDRQGIEIDYCPKCRGIWLDRGELDRLIERAESAAGAPQDVRGAPAAAYPPQPAYPPPQQGYPPPQSYPPQHGYPPHGKYRKRKSLLGELFDF
jgi:Zn-finger nucleic acid-binding protein